MDKHIKIGTEDHIDHGKQLPRVLIVGNVSLSFEGAYEILRSLEQQGEVEIIHQSFPSEEKVFGGNYEIPDEVLKAICPTGLEDFDFPWEDSLIVEKKHQKPWYHKGRW